MLFKQFSIVCCLVGILLFTGDRLLAMQDNQGNNVAAQPAWGPRGYTRADYYYLPDIECYYSVATRQFISLNSGRWVFSIVLPTKYKQYDLFAGYKVVIDQPRPFLNFSEDKIDYQKFKGRKNEQPSLRPIKSDQPEPIKSPKAVPAPVSPARPPIVPRLPKIIKPII
jgi:hypothetical protein